MEKTIVLSTAHAFCCQDLICIISESFRKWLAEILLSPLALNFSLSDMITPSWRATASLSPCSSWYAYIILQQWLLPFCLINWLISSIILMLLLNLVARSRSFPILRMINLRKLRFTLPKKLIFREVCYIVLLLSFFGHDMLTHLRGGSTGRILASWTLERFIFHWLHPFDQEIVFPMAFLINIAVFLVWGAEAASLIICKSTNVWHTLREDDTSKAILPHVFEVALSDRVVSQINMASISYLFSSISNALECEMAWLHCNIFNHLGKVNLIHGAEELLIQMNMVFPGFQCFRRLLRIKLRLRFKKIHQLFLQCTIRWCLLYVLAFILLLWFRASNVFKIQYLKSFLFKHPSLLRCRIIRPLLRVDSVKFCLESLLPFLILIQLFLFLQKPLPFFISFSLLFLKYDFLIQPLLLNCFLVSPDLLLSSHFFVIHSLLSLLLLFFFGIFLVYPLYYLPDFYSLWWNVTSTFGFFLFVDHSFLLRHFLILLLNSLHLIFLFSEQLLSLCSIQP